MIARFPTRHLLAALATAGPLLLGQESRGGLQQLSLEDLLNVKVTVASRTETTILEAPAMVTVFTAEDFRRMGARDLRDVLRTVPGFEVGIRGQLGYIEFGLRGVLTDNTEKIRILLDGVPVNENLEGSGTIIFGDMALDNIQQIEIIRGPGSALYGTNAFVGVISILTKDAAGSGAGWTVTAKGGSFATREGSVLAGWAGSRLKLSVYLHYLDSDGPASRVGRDALQEFLGPPSYSELNAGISLAGTPRGRTQEWRRHTTAQVKVAYQDFYFNGFLANIHRGPYLGTYFAVNEHSDVHPDQLQGTIGTVFRPGGDWVIEPKAYALHYRADNLWNDAPEGYRVPVGSGGTLTYTRGHYQLNQATQSTRGIEIKGTWSPDLPHRMVVGVSAEEEKLYRVRNFENVPGFGPENMFESPPIMRKEPVRTLSSLFLQDQWRLREPMTLTLGLRMDRYNDSGTSLTPRLALVWHPDAPVHVKAMYGEAFRAPTFVESYLYAASGFLRGREGNLPERIRTGEVEVGLRSGSWGTWRIGFFENRIRNLLSLVPAPGGLEYQNLPEETVVKGVEAEVRVSITNTTGIFANYSAQSGHNEATGKHLVGMANARGNLGLSALLFDHLSVHASLNLVGRRNRSEGDSRPALPGYRVVDAALTWAIPRGPEISLTAHNLLDGDQRFPSVALPLPGDFPGEGRSFQFGVRWNF